VDGLCAKKETKKIGCHLPYHVPLPWNLTVVVIVVIVDDYFMLA
jgi:hypothetical protein